MMQTKAQEAQFNIKFETKWYWKVQKPHKHCDRDRQQHRDKSYFSSVDEVKVLHGPGSHSHIYVQQFSLLYMRKGHGVQYLAQGHFGMQIWKNGIEQPTFWLEDDRSNPWATAAFRHKLGGHTFAVRL